MRKRRIFPAAAVFLAAALLLGGCAGKTGTGSSPESYAASGQSGAESGSTEIDMSRWGETETVRVLPPVFEPINGEGYTGISLGREYNTQYSSSGFMEQNTRTGDNDRVYWFNCDTQQLESLGRKVCQGVYTLDGKDYPFAFAYYIPADKPTVIEYIDILRVELFESWDSVEDFNNPPVPELQYIIFDPVWDGRYAIFKVDMVEGRNVSDAWLVDLTTGELIELMDREGADELLTQTEYTPIFADYCLFSPDGKWLSFRTNRRGKDSEWLGYRVRNRETGEEFYVDLPQSLVNLYPKWVGEETLMITCYENNLYRWYLYNVRTGESELLKVPEENTSNIYPLGDAMVYISPEEKALVDVRSGERLPLEWDDADPLEKYTVSLQDDRMMIYTEARLYIYDQPTGLHWSFSSQELQLSFTDCFFLKDDWLLLGSDTGKLNMEIRFIRLDMDGAKR